DNFCLAPKALSGERTRSRVPVAASRRNNLSLRGVKFAYHRRNPKKKFVIVRTPWPARQRLAPRNISQRASVPLQTLLRHCKRLACRISQHVPSQRRTIST